MTDPKAKQDIVEEKKVEEVPEETSTEQCADCEAKLKEAEDYKAKYLRALADYQNFERRMQNQREELIRDTEARTLIKILPFLDHLEKAEIFIKDPGLKMIKDQLAQVVTQIGAKEIELEGKEYDPEYAEAIELVEGEKDNMIVEVLQKGYVYKDKVIRPAQVKVSKKKV